MNNFYTVLVIPEKTKQVKKVVLPAVYVRVGLLLGSVGIFFLAFMVYDYVNVMKQLSENKRLQTENRQLKQQMQTFTTKLQTVQDALERIQSYTTKLRIITNQAGENSEQLKKKVAPDIPGLPMDDHSDLPPAKSIPSGRESKAQDGLRIGSPFMGLFGQEPEKASAQWAAPEPEASGARMAEGGLPGLEGRASPFARARLLADNDEEATRKIAEGNTPEPAAPAAPPPAAPAPAVAAKPAEKVPAPPVSDGAAKPGTVPVPGSGAPAAVSATPETVSPPPVPKPKKKIARKPLKPAVKPEVVTSKTIPQPTVTETATATTPSTQTQTAATQTGTQTPNADVDSLPKDLSALIREDEEKESAALRKDFEKLRLAFDSVLQHETLVELDVESLTTALFDQRDYMSSLPTLKPTNGWYTSGFGVRSSPFTGKSTMHEGLDLANHIGSAIVATAAGIITYAGPRAGYGNLVTINHGYGIQTQYGHISRAYVKVGDKVKRGQKVAAVGNTGRSTGPHVHYEVRVNGIPMDPYYYILED